MKAIPEKIYLEAIYLDNGVLPNGLNYTPSPTDIEYTRTDAFIEKACEWLKSHSDYLRIHDNGKGVRFDMTQCVIDFRRAMKVE